MARRKITLAELEADEDSTYHQTDQPLQKRKRRNVIEDDNDEGDGDYQADDVQQYGSNNNNSSSSNNNNNRQLHSHLLDTLHELMHNEHDMQHDVNQVVKLILSRELKGGFFKREYINQNLSHKKFKSDLILKEAIQVLENVYGLTLQEAPAMKVKQDRVKGRRAATATATGSGSASRTGTGTGTQTGTQTGPGIATGSSQGSVKKPLVVVSTLSREAKEVLGELWSRDTTSSLDMSKLGSDKFFMPRYSRTKTLPSSNFDLVKAGIMMVVITLVILNENHISEQQLLRSLKTFGLPDGLRQANSNINMNSPDLIKELVAREYLVKEEISIGDNNSGNGASGGNGANSRYNSRTSSRNKDNDTDKDKILEYSLGRRSLVEFTAQSVFDFIKIVYGDDFSDTIAELTIVTIERAYGVAWAQEESSVNSPAPGDGEEQERETQQDVEAV